MGGGKEDREGKRKRRHKDRDDSSDEEGSSDERANSDKDERERERDERKRKQKRERERERERDERDRRRRKERERSRSRGRNDRRRDERRGERRDERRDERRGDRRESYRRRSPTLSPSPPRRKKAPVPAADDGKPKRVFDGFQWVDCAVGVNPHGVTATNRRLHVGNLPLGSGLTETQLREFISTSMRQRGMLAPDAPDPVTSVWLSPEGIYAFVEFHTVEAANAALGLHGIMLLTSTLRIARPNTYQHGPVGTNIDGIMAMAQSTAASITAVPQPTPGLPGPMFAAMSQLASLGGDHGRAAAPPPAPLTTTVLACANMLTQEELMDEEEREGIKEDVGEECKKFGAVRAIKIPTRGNDNCKVYIKFSNIAEAGAALKSLSGRKFDGRVVEVTPLSEAQFDGVVDG